MRLAFRALQELWLPKATPSVTVCLKSYRLHVLTVSRIGCGDGVVSTSIGEECDDGNHEDGDGCTATCTVEQGYSCRSEGHRLRRT